MFLHTLTRRLVKDLSESLEQRVKYIFYQRIVYMKVLLEPNFTFEVVVDYPEYIGINSMSDSYQDILDGEIVAELKEIFPEPERDIKRVGKTNYYSVDTLNDDIDGINTWYKRHLYKATNERGYVERDSWRIQLDDDDDDDYIEDAEMTILTHHSPDLSLRDYNFDTAEGRADAMRYVNTESDLHDVIIENLYAKNTLFMGLSFNNSKLNKSIFTEAYLPMTRFNRCELREADFRYADLMYAEFQQADLTGANFKDANLRGAIFYGSNWQDAINLTDNPTFTEPAPVPVPAPTQSIDIAVPSVLKKLVKPQQKGNMLKDEVWQDENDFNVIDAKNPKKMKHCDEKWTTRNRLIVSKAEYEMLPAEYADVDPTLVSIDTDKGIKLGEDLLLEEDEQEPLKTFFVEQPDGFLFRVVQGEKYDDILVSNTTYQPTTSDYLRKATDLDVNATDLQKKAKDLDLIVYMCEAGRMGTVNKNRPLIDIGKAIGLATDRIYVDLNDFKKIVLTDTRKYKCYILYKDTNQSEKYKSLTSHNVLFNPGMNIVGQLHCNDGEEGSMSGLIWSIKPIGGNLMESESVVGGKRRKQKITRKKFITRRTKKFITRRTKKHNKKYTKKYKKHTKKHTKKYTKKHTKKHTKNIKKISYM